MKRLTDSGRYTSATEVVRAALRLLMEREDERLAKLEALRRDVQLGIDEADRGGTLTSSEMRKRIKARRAGRQPRA